MPLTANPPYVRALTHWGNLWNAPELPGLVTVRVSTRLRRSLGRYNPSSCTITLAAALTPAQIPAVLCHEAAHAVTALRYGRAARPHGVEWAGLMTLAGHAPTTRDYVECIPRGQPGQTMPGRYRYAHRCEVCQQVRWAKRPMPRWRCADCTSIGLEGRMAILDTYVET